MIGLTRERKLLIAGLIVLALLVGGAVTVIALVIRSNSGSSNTATKQGNSNSGATGSSGNLHGSTSGLFGSTVSTRSLKGILVQVNQIDICSAPELTAYVGLTNQQGQVFSNVRKDDFSVKVDGQKVDDFEFALVKERDLPLNTVLVLDRSGSMKGEPINQLRAAATTYVERTKPKDQVAVIQFDTQIDLLTGLTADKNAIKAQIAQITPRGDTALYDAAVKGAETTPECGRKAVLLMTDGEDTASKQASLEQAIQAANKRSTPVFVAGLRSEGFRPDILSQIAEKTGAQYFEAGQPQELTSIYQKIDEQLAGQYVFKFKLNIEKQNKERRLEISAGVEGSTTTSVRSFAY